MRDVEPGSWLRRLATRVRAAGTLAATAALCPLVVLAVPPAAAASTAGLSTPTAPGQATKLGTVIVVHALEGIQADVYLDGADRPALSGFDYRRVTAPLTLPAGPHRADLRRSGDPATATPLLSGSFEVSEGQLITVAALLSPDGQPRWLAFPDDGRRFATGPAELRFRHLAATGPVTLRVDGAVVQTAVANLSGAPQPPAIPMAVGSHTVEVDNAAGAPIASQTVTTGPGSIHVVQLIGRDANSTLSLLPATWATPSPGALAQAAQAPTRIPSGNSGLAATPGPVPGGRRPPALVDAVAGVFPTVPPAAWAGASAEGTFPRLGRPTTPGVVLAVPVADGGGAQPDPAVDPSSGSDLPAAWTGILPAGAGAGPAPGHRPVSVRIPALAVAARVVPTGLDAGGTLQLPPDPGVIAWYDGGPTPGGSGSAVLAGHVDYDGTEGALFRLARLATRSVIEVTFADGTTRTFRASSPPTRLPKTDLAARGLFRRGGAPTLTLVTCGGAFDPVTRTYADNVVVTAVPA